ncbi:uncharacterized protein LOC142327917 isoform X3 [Lycorma delicatula]|uniref:uncharacterized protein LOC142327917 isoform X3 n=1 Tax=Lycorma delicatula TaxID=130591 RepID=UPI003F516FF9
MSNDDLSEKVDELQIQLYIAMAVGFFGMIILLILDIILFGLVERYRNQLKVTKEKKYRYPSNTTNSTNTNTTSRVDIVPDEDLGRRGFRRYPGFSSGLVARVEGRGDPMTSRQMSTMS